MDLCQTQTDQLESGGRKLHLSSTTEVVGSSKSDLQQVAGESIRVIDLRRQQENGEKNSNPTKISPNLSEISLESRFFHRDLENFRRKLGFFRRNLENFHWNLEIFARICVSFDQFGFFGF